MLERRGSLIARTVMIVYLAAALTAVPVGAVGQGPELGTAKASGKQEASPAVKVEVKKREGGKGAEVEVQVEDGQYKDKAATKKTATAKIVEKTREERFRERFDAIYETARKIGAKIDYAATKAAWLFGQGANEEVYAGIKLLKLLVSLGILLFFFALERLLNWLIGTRLKRVPEDDGVIVWKGFVLEALRKPLSLIVWVNGIHLALSPLYPHFEEPDGANLVYSVASGATNFATSVAFIWFLYALAGGNTNTA